MFQCFNVLWLVIFRLVYHQSNEKCCHLNKPYFLPSSYIVFYDSKCILVLQSGVQANIQTVRYTWLGHVFWPHDFHRQHCCTISLFHSIFVLVLFTGNNWMPISCKLICGSTTYYHHHIIVVLPESGINNNK